MPDEVRQSRDIIAFEEARIFFAYQDCLNRNKRILNKKNGYEVNVIFTGAGSLTLKAIIHFRNRKKKKFTDLQITYRVYRR